MVLAMTADALQIFVFPYLRRVPFPPLMTCSTSRSQPCWFTCSGGIGFLPAFAAELVPGVDLVPFWTLSVLNVYRKWKQITVNTEGTRKQRPELQHFEGCESTHFLHVPAKYLVRFLLPGALTGSEFGPSGLKLEAANHASVQLFSTVYTPCDPSVYRHKRTTSNRPCRRHPLEILRAAHDGTAPEGKGHPELWPGHAYALSRGPTFG